MPGEDQLKRVKWLDSSAARLCRKNISYAVFLFILNPSWRAWRPGGSYDPAAVVSAAEL